MDHRTRQLVQDSWTTISIDKKRAADVFYSRLFELDPSIQYLFRGDLDDQKQRLMGMFNIAVRGLDKLDDMLPALRQLGQRHIEYKVLAQHYDTMGRALVFMVSEILGDDTSPEIESAWAEAYGYWSAAMKSGAAESP